MDAEELIGMIEDVLGGDLDENAHERADALNEIGEMLRSGHLLVSDCHPLKMANDIIAAADTSDYEDCDVCAELQECCVVHEAATAGVAQMIGLLYFVLDDPEIAWEWMCKHKRDAA